MLHATLRRVSLRSDSLRNTSPVRKFIPSSRCASGTLVSRLDFGVEQLAALHITAAETRETSSVEHQITGQESTTLSDSPPNNEVPSSKTQTSSGKKSSKKTTKAHSGNEGIATPAKAAKPKKPRFVNPPPRKIEAFLEKLESETDTLTLTDMESYRPPVVADTRSPRYEAEYNKVMNTLIRSFNMITLRRIFDIYSIPHLPASLQRKIPYAQAILEYWGWKPFSVVREDILDVTKSSELRFPLTSGEAFLLMGKDGVELLNLAQRYGAHLSFTDHPISLKAKGLQGSLKRLQGYLKSFKKDIQVETASLHLGHKLPFETVKLISRLSGAYLAAEEDKFRISFHRSQPRSLEIAKRLATQAASRKTADIAQSIIMNPGFSGHTPSPDPQSSPYSLYPFTPQQRLSWEFSSSNSFRLRRVGHWLETIHPTKHGLDEVLGSYDALKTVLTSCLSNILSQSDIANSTLEISACTGHLLFLSPAHGHTLLPPILGQLNVDDILQWTRKFPELVTFNASIPASILTSPTYKEQHIRKLIYIEQIASTDDSNLPKTLQLEIARPTENAEENTNHEVQGFETRCYISEKSGINVLMPDRPTDVQISAASAHAIPLPDLPHELSTFVVASESASQSNPNVPLTFILNSIKYVLNSDEHIHREFKTICLGNKHINLTTETSTDADINQHGTVCKIVCDDYRTAEGWDAFLDICNRIAIEN